MGISIPLLTSHIRSVEYLLTVREKRLLKSKKLAIARKTGENEFHLVSFVCFTILYTASKNVRMAFPQNNISNIPRTITHYIENIQEYQ